ncbi:MAG: GTPase domain-containing protein [Candidatus Obscuribacterales bacterium]|nr:GTPase domain-containing protein [Candidatus Obscuribacterales bacterium]
MAIINFLTKEIHCKLVYYGTGLGGKTANLKFIYSSLAAETRGEFVSLATATERTLFFDYMGLELGQVQNFTTRFSMYTVPGQVEYNASRKLILNGADGIIFVADSDPMRRQENISALRNMVDNLSTYGLTIHSVPVVIQYNKRDLTNAMPLSIMEDDLNPYQFPSFESVAADGPGVFATLKQASKLVLNRLQ